MTVLATSQLRADAASAAPDAPRLVLHDAELSRRLDGLFDAHFTAPRRSSARVRTNHVLKRLLDVGSALVGLALIWPIMLLAALATLLDTGRPVFYSQSRRIRFGRRATIYKMRTLVIGADRKLDALVSIKHNGKFLNITKQADSYTRVGRWLERLWIVELPQLWNVLTGQMSMVGNRPIPDYVINALGPAPEVVERFASPQGMTGYVQILGRDNVTDDQRIQLEYRYSRVYEDGDVFFEDLRIIALTVLSYLGLVRGLTVERFLGAGPRQSVAAGTPKPVRNQTAALTDGLACPTCYVVEDACDPTACHQECVTSCEPNAISIRHGRAAISDACIACSACVTACPRHAIDKTPLTRVNGSLHCAGCGTHYPIVDGVADLLPRNTQAKTSPYFDFYDREYLHDNPLLHTEDTAWKLRELAPLVARGGSCDAVLDLGCGAGEIGRSLAARVGASQRTASDWSGDILSVARRTDDEGRFVRSDAAHLPFRNATFDLALLIDVIEHQALPDQVLRELRRTSKRMLMRTPLEDCWYERLRRRRKDLFRESSGHVVHFSLRTVRDRLRTAGWRVLRDESRPLAWSHWKRVLAGNAPFSHKCTAAARVFLRAVLPAGVHRRWFVTNYNALCESTFVPQETHASASSSPIMIQPREVNA